MKVNGDSPWSSFYGGQETQRAANEKKNTKKHTQMQIEKTPAN